ncbi:MAG TPA: hypothetical protein VMJ10_03950 [Kofleriaceae bacterium]|nr:hypothetical protein [Kofleriaceae bacterium]
MTRAWLLSLLVATTAAAAPPRAWLGTFQPAPGAIGERCADCAKRKIAPVAGSVRVLTSGDGVAPPEGPVVVVSPLLGVVARGKAVHGQVTVPWFDYDLRDGDDGVLVLEGDVPVGLPPATPADARAIEQVILHDDTLSGVRRALVGLELGVVDIDGDGVADFAVTYGCNAWWDGQCQSRGQFFLVHRGARWVEIE